MWNNDVEQGFVIGKPQTSACLHLSLVNGLDAPAENFTNVGGGVQSHGDDTGHKVRKVDSQKGRHKGNVRKTDAYGLQAVVDDEQLNKEGG